MIYNFDDLSFQILTIDRFIHREGVFDVKERPYAAISYRVSGVGEFEIMNRRFVTSPGDIIFIPANASYRVKYTASESIVVHLTDCNYSIPEVAKVENQVSMEIRFMKLLESWEERHSANLAKSQVYDILQKLESNESKHPANSVFSNCIRYVEENFCDPELDIQKISEHEYISPSSLQRAFRHYYAMSPKQYLIKLRLSRAIELLAEGELSVKQVALACGFADEKYFSRVFSKRYGYPPSHFYRKLFL